MSERISSVPKARPGAEANTISWEDGMIYLRHAFEASSNEAGLAMLREELGKSDPELCERVFSAPAPQTK